MAEYPNQVKAYSKSRNQMNLLRFVPFFVLTVLISLFFLIGSRYWNNATGVIFDIVAKTGADENYGKTPMCNFLTGVCGEAPDRPSPRTIFSAKSKKQYDLWWKAHVQLVRSANEYVQRRRGTTNKPPLVLLGDSITEEWIGSNMGVYDKRWHDVPKVLQDLFESEFDPLVLAIGGDQTQHLLWRLQSGELLSELAKDESAVFCLLIGTNNIGSGVLPQPTALGVIAVAKYILENTSGRLVMLHLLPRGDAHRLEKLCPPRCSSDGSPFASFMPAIEKVNIAIQKEGHTLKTTYGQNRLDVVDCGTNIFIPNDKNEEKSSEVREDLMPDLLHPNLKGHYLLSQCIIDCVKGSC